MSSKKILVAYFSRSGEQYSVGNISKGNTEIIAEMIADKTKGDLFEIKPLKDNYPQEYKALTAAAMAEQKANARPKICGKIDNFSDYDVVFIGYPNWWGNMPMLVYSFMEAYDFTAKTVVAFCTHEGSGLGSTENKIQNVTKAKEMLKGFEIYGHAAQNSRNEARAEVEQWLKQIGF